MVYIFNEMPPHEISMPEKNVTSKWIDGRPTFKQIFDWVNEVTSDDDINIIANSDIYFDIMGIEMMKAVLRSDDCWALTRWDVKSFNVVRENGKMVPDIEFMNRRDSQDTWSFKGKIKAGNYDFKIGVPGCDNHLLWQLCEAGYTLCNPSWSVRTFHLHLSDERKWYGMPQIPPPYLLIDPSEI